ncbi:MAG: molybdenum cofactor biosynthesis protein MoaE [Spirochaetes bacterium]|nr:molybdenum cofactor biosynthesis protein MoaE [Spirochaetota bacterium]HPA73082.1 molybdenum cofactor biosynthesis protein MoaE [Spirochaetota bacterium]
MLKVVLQREPIDVTAVMDATFQESDGAQVSFVGRPRNESNGKAVARLEYEAYDTMARKELEKIGADVMNRWPITKCSIVHRFGVVEIGEPSILIVVSSPHRDEAFSAVRYVIDTVKKTVPIWKKEFYTDGGVWVSDRT